MGKFYILPVGIIYFYNMVESDTHTISMAASDLSWSEIDKRAKGLGFKSRSSYLQYLSEKDIYKSNMEKKDIILIILFFEMSMITLLLAVGVL